MGARARLGRPALVALGLLVASAVVFQLVRSRIGVGFSSDSYSYLAWAERFLSEGKLGHTPYDFTAPKPVVLAVATLGEAFGAPIAVFGTWAILSYLGAVLAAAALAKRFAGWPAAVAAAALAAVLPPLVRGGWSGDATVAYAACVVGAAALSPGRVRPAAALLGVAGLLRPEAWGLAAVYAALAWRGASRRERAIAVAAVLVPPALWLSFDWIATGDPLYGAHATERYGVVAVPLRDLPGILRDLVPELLTWPLLVLGVVALGAGLRRRPLDPAVVFPVAMVLGLLVEVQLGLIGAGSLGRYGLGMFLFLAAGAAIVLAQAPGRARIPVLVAGTVACLALLVGRLDAVRDLLERRGDISAQLDDQLAPVVERTLAGHGLVATEREWGGALSVYSDVPRERIVPVGRIGRAIDPGAVRGYLILAGLQRGRDERGRELPPSRETSRSAFWRFYEPG
jgi:hypothetical protein